MKWKIKQVFYKLVDHLTEKESVEGIYISLERKSEIIKALNDLELQVNLKAKQKEMLSKIEGMKIDEKLIDDILLSDYDLDTLKSLLDIVD